MISDVIKNKLNNYLKKYKYALLFRNMNTNSQESYRKQKYRERERELF